MHQYSDSPELQKKKHFNFNFSRYSNSYFTKTAGFVSSISVGIKKILVVQIFWMEGVSICVSCISVLTVRKLQEVLLFLLRSLFDLVFRNYYRFEFLHHELNLKHNTCNGASIRKLVDFVRCIRIQIVQTFRKGLLSICVFNIQTHPSLSLITTGLSSSINVSMKKNFTRKTISTVVFSILFLSLENWSSDIPFEAIDNFSSRYWNSHFAVARGLVSSLLVSGKNLKFVKIFWQIKQLIFPRNRILINRKFSIVLILLIYHLWPQLQDSFLPRRSHSRSFRPWGVLLLVTIFSVTSGKLLRV